MKTAKQTTENFPRLGRLSLYICGVVVLCFFNWVALNAQITRMANNFNSQMVIALEEEDEPVILLLGRQLDDLIGYAGDEWE